MDHKHEVMAVLQRSPFAYRCVNCGAVYEVRVFDEGEKATLPIVEFCPICSLPHNRLWAERADDVAI
jgi:uncharacterized Zn finger protein